MAIANLGYVEKVGNAYSIFSVPRPEIDFYLIGH